MYRLTNRTAKRSPTPPKDHRTHHKTCPNSNKRHQTNSLSTAQMIFGTAVALVFAFMILYYVTSVDKPDVVDKHKPITRHNQNEFPLSAENDKFQKKYFSEGNADNRIVTNIILDKAIYRPDETLYLSAFLLNGVSLMPLSYDKATENIRVQIIDAKNIVIADQRHLVEIKNSIIALQYQIPSDLKGGEYQIKVSYPNRHRPTGVRKFQILNSNQKMNPKIRKQAQFLKKTYSAGEQCKVKILCTDCGNNILITSIVAKVDHRIVYTLESPLTLSYDSEKNEDNIQSVLFDFKMPDTIESGDGNIAIAYQQDSVIETLTKTIPITLGHLDINAYAESNSYLIPGLKHQRVYFEGFNPKTNEPCDFEGEIVSLPQQTVVSRVTSEHEGRGVSDYFDVEMDTQYAFRLSLPMACKGQIIALKTVPENDMKLIANRAVLSSTQSAYAFHEQIRIKIAANIKDVYKVKLYKKEVLIASINVDIESDDNRVYNAAFNAKDLKDTDVGVLRMTVCTSDNIPIAERLIFRHSQSFVQFEVNVRVVSDSDSMQNKAVIKPPQQSHKPEMIASPSDGIEVSIYSYLIDCKDFHKQPISVKGNVFVTDDSLSSIIENRLLPPRLPSLVFFESDVDHLEDANIYLPYASPTDRMEEQIKKSNVYIDLLLGTQGWRRFAYQNIAQFFEGQSGDNLEKRERLFVVQQYRDVVYRREAAPMKRGRMAGINFFGAKEMAPQAFIMAKVDSIMDNEVMNNLIMDDMVEGAVMYDEDADLEFEEPIMNEGQQNLQKKRKKKVLKPKIISYERVYAKKQRKFSKNEFRDGIIRTDFEPTVFVSRNIDTVCQSDYCGQVLRFGLSDIVGIYKIFIDGYASDPVQKMVAFGSNAFNIRTELPLEIDALLPSILIAGDEPLVPVMIQTSAQTEEIQINIDFENSAVALKNTDNSKQETTVRNVKFLRTYLPLKSSSVNNKTMIRISADTTKYKDSIRKEVEVMIGGFAQTISSGGIIDKNEHKKLEFQLPSDYIEQTLRIDIKGYASPVGQLNEAIQHLIREPCGCFEQTSSTTYPLVMALRYLNAHRSNVDRALIDKAKEMLRRGYHRLISYESKGGGFEWFGGFPAHEALTAYGVLEFAAMSSSEADMPGLVDQAMLQRTIDWLLDRRDNKGGFQRNEQSLDSFGRAPVETTNAYITWSLVKSGLFPKGDPRLEQEIAALLQFGEETSDSYIIALAALTSFAVQNKGKGIAFLNRLASMQDTETGLVKQIEHTITNSGGEAKDIEATALSALALMAASDDSYAANIRLAIEFLSSKCKNGAYSSTQATALSLEAIVEYDRLFSAQIKPGHLQLWIDQTLVESIAFGEDGHSLLQFDGDKIMNNNRFKTAKHVIELRLVQENESFETKLPYSVYLSYNVENPESNEKVSIALQTELIGSSVVIKEGEIVTLNVELTNLRTEESIPMVVAIIGYPGGLELRIEQLRELKQGSVIDFYETSPNELILYFRSMESGQRVTIPIELLAVIPGTYSSPASRAYLFYSSEFKAWADGIKVNIEPNQDLSFNQGQIHYLFQS